MSAGASKKKKTGRLERPEESRDIVIQKRDLDILEALYNHGYLRTDQIISLLQNEHGGLPDRWRKRLKYLFQNGYTERPDSQIEYHRRSGNTATVHGLGEQGALHLDELRGIPRGGMNYRWKNKSVGRPHLDHSLSVADFMIAIELASRNQKGAEFIPWTDLTPDAERPSWSVNVRKYPERIKGLRNTVKLIPDGVFSIRLKGGKRGLYFVEVDRSTESVTSRDDWKRSVRRKFIAYHESWKQALHLEHFGIRLVRTLFIAKSQRRIESFKEAMLEVLEEQPYPRKKKRHILFALQKDVVGDNVLDHEWENAKDDVRVTLNPLD